jgi:hypothetical protein
MQKISILLLLVFIVIIKSFGQSDSIKATEIDKYVYNIDTLNTKFDKMYRYSNFYYENENVIYERHRGTWQSGLAFDINKDYSDIFGYNKSMTIDFLRTYVIKLYGKLLNYR